MRLNDCKSSKLLPRTPDVEARLAWCCAAFDAFIGRMDARRHALSAPFSADAVHTLTDAELQQYYEELGLAPYYADISRTARENFLVAQWHNLRKLGTHDAVLALCRYIFGDNPVSLEIVDNLAFDENGVLTDMALLNLYDAVVVAENPQLDRLKISRISSNLTRFGRVTQQLRALVIRFEAYGFDAHANAASVECAEFYDNGWIDCTPSYPQIQIGIDTVCPSGTTSLSSKYYWFYEFLGGSDCTNLWNPEFYADNLNPTNPDPNYAEIPSSYYSGVWLWSGSASYDLAGSGATFKLAVYNGKPEFYTGTSASASAADSSCVIELVPGSLVFGGVESFSLPSSLYTISGTTITWNTSHPCYNSLYGKMADPV